MKIAICTIGSTGDIQPYLALALSLKAAGHAVCVISHPLHQPRFVGKGIEFRACGPIVPQQEINEMLDKMLTTRNPVKQLKMLMLEAFFADGVAYFKGVKAALADCDLALIHMVDFLASEAAAQLGMPRIGGILAPTGIPTAYAVLPPFLNLGRLLNPIAWKIVAAALAPVDRAAMNYLKQLGGPTVTIKSFHVLSPTLNLIAASPTLAPTYPDLPQNIEVVGPWVLEEPTYTPPADLQAFLERFPRPVVVSFGSMGGSHGPALTRTVHAALALAGKPAIIQRGYSGLGLDGAPDNVFFADFIPHDWLFAHAACVIHHAGAGTTTAVARAGVPHVPVVFIADQPYFAGHLHRLGVATQKLWYYQMQPKNLASRMLTACDSAEMQAKAHALAPIIRAETGNARTVARIEQFARDLRL
jgi:sterol 3beta-glucosyltransferase